MHKRLTIANCVTTTRLLLVLIMIHLILKSSSQISMGILVLSLLLLNYAGDMLDGYLARRLNQVTRLGAIFDVAVDALLLLSVYFILAFKGVINYYLFYLTAASLLQFVLSSLWRKKFSNKKSVFTFDALGRFSTVLIEVMLIFNIAMEFINISTYIKFTSVLDFITIIIGTAATLNRFRFYFMVQGTSEV